MLENDGIRMNQGYVIEILGNSSFVGIEAH